MEYKAIKVESGPGRIAVIILNRPGAKNALSIDMRREISAALAALQSDKTVGAVIFAGAGGVFCAGFDLKEFAQADLMRDVFESSTKYHRDVWHFPKPTIAAVAGPALGGGFDLACLCDIRICAPSAKFGHPEIKFGGPPLYTPLRWIVGSGPARDLCLTGRNIRADQALAIGLVSRVVEEDKLLEQARATAAQILQAPDAALSAAKQYMVANEGKGFEESFVAEHDDVFQDFIKQRGGA